MKLIWKTLLFLTIVACIALGVYGLMKLLNVDTIEGLQNIVNNYGVYAYLIIILLQIIQVVFIPISNQIITVPAMIVLGTVKGFLCSWIGIEIGTILLYFIGKYGGGKFLEWLLGDKEKATKFEDLIKTRRLFYLVGMLIAVIPDDVLTTLTGVAKLNFWYVLIVSTITRGICIVFTAIGYTLILQSWLGICVVIIFYIMIITFAYIFLRYEPQIEEYFSRRKND